MRCLVTGGAGFIGSHLVESLLGKGYEVTVIDDLSTGSLSNLSHVRSNNRLEFIKGDILVLPEIEYLVSKVDCVYHLAAAVGVDLVIREPVRTIVTNVNCTERVLKAASRHKTRVLIASTSEVYGKSISDVFSEDDDLLIGPPLRSRWGYACSKLLDEFYSMAFYHETSLPVIVARLFNTVGPRQTGRYGMVIPRFIESALKNEPIHVFGTGEQSRCFCHVKDTVRALISLAESSVSGDIFNVGSNWDCTINQLAKRIIVRSGSRSVIEHVSYDKAYAPGFDDMMRRFPDISKIKKAFNWEPSNLLDDIIDDVICDMKNMKGKGCFCTTPKRGQRSS